MTTSACAQCRFFHDDLTSVGMHAKAGECRKNTPMIEAVPAAPRWGWRIWPAVWPSDWCGEFEQFPTNDGPPWRG